MLKTSLKLLCSHCLDFIDMGGMKGDILWNVFFSGDFHCAENKFHAATFHGKVFRERGGF